MAARTWIADSTKNWSDVTAWDGGAAVPATTDTVTFNSTHVGSCTADAFGTWTGSFTISSGYTGTITKSAGVAWTSTSTFSMAAGTFNQGTGAMTTMTTCTISGGTFNKNNTGNFACTAFLVSGGTFTCSSTGTFTSTTFAVSSGSFTGGTAAMSTTAVTFSSTGTITATSGTWTLAGSWTQSGSTTTFTANSGTINITAASTFNDARSTFNKINITTAAADVTISASTTAPLGAAPTTTVTSGTLTINGTMTWTGIWTHTGAITMGSTGTLSTGTTLALQNSNWTMNASATIPASLNITLNITGAGGKTFAGAGVTYGGEVYITGSNSATVTITGANTFANFRCDDRTVAHTILFSANQTFTGTWSVSGGSGFAVTVSGAFTLTNSSGKPFESDWLVITNTSVVGQWYAGWNSTTSQGSADTGWKRKAMTHEVIPVIRQGTAQAGAAGSVTLDANASAVDDFYKDDLVVIIAGTGAGQSLAISGYTGSTKVAAVVPNWATTPDSTSIFQIQPLGRVDVGRWNGTAPNDLIAGRVDSNVQAMANGVVTAAAIADAAIDAATFAADTDTYQAKVTVDRDTANTTDRYSVAFFKNGQPIVAGITSPTIQVIKQTDGSDLVASTALTQVASTGLYKYTEATNRITTGAAYYAIVTATIGGSSRTWNQPISRDS